MCAEALRKVDFAQALLGLSVAPVLLGFVWPVYKVQVTHIADGFNFLTCTSWFPQTSNWVGESGISHLTMLLLVRGNQSNAYSFLEGQWENPANRWAITGRDWINKQRKPVLLHSGPTHNRSHLQYSVHSHRECVPGPLSDPVHRCLSPLYEITWYLYITHVQASSLCVEARIESKASHIRNLSLSYIHNPLSHTLNHHRLYDAS